MGMQDDTPEKTFGFIATELNRRSLAYLHLVEPAIVGTVLDDVVDPRWDQIIREMRELYRGTLVIAGGYARETAEAALRAGRADIIAFGRLFIANPDLPERFRLNAPLNEPDPSTFFGGDAHGYTDYPPLQKRDATKVA